MLLGWMGPGPSGPNPDLSLGDHRHGDISAPSAPCRLAVALASPRSSPTYMLIRSPAPEPETVTRVPGRPLLSCRLRLAITRSCTWSTLSVAVKEPKARIGWHPP